MKIVGTLLGVLVLCGVLFLFWWLRWQEESQVHVYEFIKQADMLEDYWNKQSVIQDGRFEIGYKEAVASGFPFTMKVHLVKPYLRDSHGSKQFTITMPFIDLVPIDNASRSFRVEYPDYADAIFYYGSARTNYYIHLSSLPAMTLRKHTPRSAAVNEYALTFPPSLVLTVDSNRKQFKLPMKFEIVNQPVWTPMISDMRLQMRYFQDFLRRSMMGL